MTTYREEKAVESNIKNLAIMLETSAGNTRIIAQNLASHSLEMDCDIRSCKNTGLACL